MGSIAGMGFGTLPFFDDTDGLYNAQGGLEYLIKNTAVRKATIMTPHIYGEQVTGIDTWSSVLLAIL